MSKTKAKTTVGRRTVRAHGTGVLSAQQQRQHDHEQHRRVMAKIGEADAAAKRTPGAMFGGRADPAPIVLRRVAESMGVKTAKVAPFGIVTTMGSAPGPLRLRAAWVLCSENPSAAGWCIEVGIRKDDWHTIGDLEMPFGRDANKAEIEAWLRANLAMSVEVQS